MGKVTFEYNDEEDYEEIRLVVNRHKLKSALYELNDFYRQLYNGKLYTDDIITVKDNKVLTPEDYKAFQEKCEYPVKGTKEFISTDYLENELDSILNTVMDLLDY